MSLHVSRRYKSTDTVAAAPKFHGSSLEASPKALEESPEEDNTSTTAALDFPAAVEEGGTTLREPARPESSHGESLRRDSEEELHMMMLESLEEVYGD